MQKAQLKPAQAKTLATTRQGGIAIASPQGAQVAQLEATINASPDITAQRKLQDMMDTSPRMVAQRKSFDGLFGTAQRVEDEEEQPLQLKSAEETPVQLEQQVAVKPNNTGLPDNLKSGIENLSGMAMDHVKVHYNSSQPAQLNALAYAQGSDIHVAPGQEKHLPHEAWHVVQQAQGRVKPTMQMKDGVGVNDDKGLEREADLMGGKAVQIKDWKKAETPPPLDTVSLVVQRAYDAPVIGSVENLVMRLAFMTPVGVAAWNAGRGALVVRSGAGWTTYTKDGVLGITVEKTDYAKLGAVATGTALVSGDENELAIHVAHELTHLRHLVEDSSGYAARGDRTLAPKCGWDADPEEELTIRGVCTIPKEVWEQIKTERKKTEEHFRNLQQDCTAQGAALGGEGKLQGRKMLKQAKENKDLADVYVTPEVPTGSVLFNGTYIVLDPMCENAAREHLGMALRGRYTVLIDREDHTHDTSSILEVMHIKQCYLIAKQEDMIKEQEQLMDSQPGVELMNAMIGLHREMLDLRKLIERESASCEVGLRLLPTGNQ